MSRFSCNVAIKLCIILEAMEGRTRLFQRNKSVRIPIKKGLRRVLWIKWGAWWDCLESLALNVSTCFASEFPTLCKSTPHSARSSLEPSNGFSSSSAHKKTLLRVLLYMGRLMGFEPMHIGTTIRGLNRLTTGAIFPTKSSISNKDLNASKKTKIKNKNKFSKKWRY